MKNIHVLTPGYLCQYTNIGFLKLASIICFTFFAVTVSAMKDEPVPFTCGGTIYSVMDGSFYYFNDDVNVMDFEMLGESNSVRLSAMGFNVTDHFVYGIAYDEGGQATNELVMLDSEVSVNNYGSIGNLPAVMWRAGDVDDQGNLCVYEGTDGLFYKIHLQSRTATPISLTSYPDIDDFNFLDGLFYSVSASGDLVTINPETGGVTIQNIPGAMDSDIISTDFGSSWISNERVLFVHENNTGNIYRIMGVGNGEMNSVLAMQTNSSCGFSDGANCTFNVGEADTDCDGITDDVDVCAGGDDSVDADGDGNPDCANYPGFDYLPEEWRCGNNGNKVLICHNDNNPHTVCVSPNAVDAHLVQGDYLGPCYLASCGEERPVVKKRSAAEKAIIPGFSLFPNPAFDQVNIQLDNPELVEAEVMILNSFGQLMYQNNTNRKDLTVSLDKHRFVTGIYMVVVKTSEHTVSKRLVITN